MQTVLMRIAVICGSVYDIGLVHHVSDLEKLAAGETVEQILNAHPRLTREGVQAALLFASEALRADVIYPFAGAA